MQESSFVIVCDTSILINFMNINRLDLFQKHFCNFIITDHVKEEITDDFEQQQIQLQEAIKQGVIEEVSLLNIEELQLFAQLVDVKRLGYGECSSIACAIHNGYTIAIDDNAATKEAKKINPDISILTTQDLMVSMISEELIDVVGADRIKTLWEETHRFRLKINSFADVIS